MDANGVTATGRVYLDRDPEVIVVASRESHLEDSGEPVAFHFIRAGSGDLAANETIAFSVSGTAAPDGLRADYALAGQASFDPLLKRGTVVIPAGQSEAIVYVAVLQDDIDEAAEDLTLSIESSSSLPISSSNGSATITISDDTTLFSQTFSVFNDLDYSWQGWTNLANMKANGRGGDDWFDWTVGQGPTTTSGTGPSGDHTTGTARYLYAEASGNTGKFAIVESPAISVPGHSSINLSFWYHMYGPQMGSLSVDLYVNGNLAKSGLWSRSGQQSSNGTDWKQAVVSLDPWLPASDIKLRFRADMGAGEGSDIAIDDVHLTTGSSGTTMPPQVLVDPAGFQGESGQSVYLSVIPEGFPAPRIQGLKDGAPIAGATGPSFYIASLETGDVGNYQAVVTNDLGADYSIPASVDIGDPPPFDPPGQAFLNWTVSEGIPFDQSSLGLDPDKDGIPNLLEFAYGLPPMEPDTTALPACRFVAEGGQSYLYFTYRRRIGGTGTTGVNYTVDDITYTVEVSQTLSGNWNSGSGLFEVVSVEAYGAGHQVVTLRLPLSGNPAFMRLSVSAAFAL